MPHTTEFMEVNEPVADQSSLGETSVIPDENNPKLLWAICLLWWNEDIVECVEQRDQMDGVVGAKGGGMVMEDTVVAYGYTHTVVNLPPC